MAKLDYNLDTYNYFLAFCPDLNTRKLLDYGCHYGTFLKNSGSNFPHNQFTGIDVDIDAIESAKIDFPEAVFYRSNTYNIVYNRTGDTDFRLPLSKHDAIISYSVLTHTTVDDFFGTIDYLYTALNSGGKLMISYLDIDHSISVEFFTHLRRKEYGSCDPLTTEDYVYLIDNRSSKEVSEGNYFLLYFKNSYLSQRLQNYNHQLFNAPHGISGCFQSCLVITKP